MERLKSWGLMISPTCMLCNVHDETRDHMFFTCDYSKSIWTHFTSKANLSPLSQYMACLLWTHNVTPNKSSLLSSSSITKPLSIFYSVRGINGFIPKLTAVLHLSSKISSNSSKPPLTLFLGCNFVYLQIYLSWQHGSSSSKV